MSSPCYLELTVVLFRRPLFFTRYTVPPVGPLPQIDEAAAFTAKGTPRILFGPLDWLLAGGAGNDSGFFHRLQQVILNRTGWPANCGRPFVTCRKRMLKRCRLPLTSA